MVDSEKMEAIGWIPIHEACDYESLVDRLTPIDQKKLSKSNLELLRSIHENLELLMSFSRDYSDNKIYYMIKDLLYSDRDANFYYLENIPGDALKINSKILITDDFIPICVRLREREHDTEDESALILLFVKSEEGYNFITSIIMNIQKSGIILWKIYPFDQGYQRAFNYFYQDKFSKTQRNKIYEYLLWDIYCKFVYLVDGSDTRFIDVLGGQFFTSPYKSEADNIDLNNEYYHNYYHNYLKIMSKNITIFLTKSKLILERAYLDLSKAISDIAPNDKMMNMTPQLFDMSNSPYYPFSEYNSRTKEAVRYVRLYNKSQMRYNALFKEIGDTESYYKLIETVNKLIEDTLKKYGDYLKKENDFQKRLNLALNIDSFTSSKKMQNLTYIMVLIGFGTMAIEIVANLSLDYIFGITPYLSLIFLLFSLPFGMMLLFMDYDGVSQNISNVLLMIKEADIGLGLFQLPILIIVLAIALWVIFCKNKNV